MDLELGTDAVWGDAFGAEPSGDTDNGFEESPGPESVQLPACICVAGNTLHEILELLLPPEMHDGFALTEAVTEMTVTVVAR